MFRILLMALSRHELDLGGEEPKKFTEVVFIDGMQAVLEASGACPLVCKKIFKID
jgi:hypothetical protein